MKTLRKNLDRYFQRPINYLNYDTQEMWKKTIQYAQCGFVIRIAMSFIIFAIGTGLLLVSSRQFISGTLEGAELFGPGISFVGGLSAMIAVVYAGPLKDIQKSVNDLGIASAAFIAYVHRVLEISHTFSFYYLNSKISFDETKKSNELIEDAVDNIINELDEKRRSLSNDEKEVNPRNRGGFHRNNQKRV